MVSRAFSARVRLHSSTCGFTFVELMIVLGIFVIFSTGAVVAMTEVNRQASAARLRTLALAVAQQRIDEILTIPWPTTSRPPLLTPGTTTDGPLPLNNDATNNQAGLRSAFTNLDTEVPALRVTEIVDVPPRKVRATVTITYQYRGRPYGITVTTLRTTDDI
jgi:prepilin-type N-terminal cleavage/methylation domain-containing protein